MDVRFPLFLAFARPLSSVAGHERDSDTKDILALL